MVDTGGSHPWGEFVKHLVAALVGLSTLGAAATASANGFYVSGSIGALDREPYDSTSLYARDPFGNSLSINGVAQPYVINNRQHYDLGVDVDAAGGYRFDLHKIGALRTEIGLEYGEYDEGVLDRHSGANPNFTTLYSSIVRPVGGVTTQRVNATFNVFYDLPKFWRFRPYFGGGVGYHYGWSPASTRLDSFTYSVPANPVSAPSGPTISGPPGARVSGQQTLQEQAGNTHDGAYLAEVGVAIPILPRLSLVPAYRYTNNFHGNVPASVAKVGLRYEF
jgi:opacity protein-like surface antigen